MKKICVVVNSRANYARIKSVLHEIKKSSKLNLQLVLGASSLVERFGELEKIIRNDGFTVTNKIYSIVEGDNPSTMAKSTGLAIIELSNLFTNIRPDVVLTVADRFETIATAIVASYMNIPLVHTQGGEITGSIDESVRHAVTKLSNLHFPSTQNSLQNLLKMGEHKRSVFLTGCPSIDLAKKQYKNRGKINLSKILNDSVGVGNLKKLVSNYIVVMQHPVTTEYKNTKKNILQTIKAVHLLKKPAVWFWPNIDAGNDVISKEIRKFRERYNPKNILFVKNFSPENFLNIIIKSSCIIGNSSVAIRECSFLGIPAVNIGTRQNGREHGKNVKHVDYNFKKIVKATKYQISKKRYESSKIFGDGTAGKKIVKILEKYKFQNLQKKLEIK